MAAGVSIVSGVAGRFASALLDLAEDEKSVDAVERDLDNFGRLIAENPDLARLVRSPVFTAEEQTRAVAAILDKADIGGLAANFLKLVAARRRLFAAGDMIGAYKALVAQKRGVVKAEVTVAETPSDRRLDEIRAALKDVAGSDIAVELKVDPAIVGGLVVKLGSRMVDASLRSKLNAIRLAMKEA